MNFFELGLYILTIIVMIATPGPVMLLVANTGVKYGFKAAFKTILGTNFSSLLLIAVSILILKGVFSIDERIFIALKLLGSIYIAYIGYTILKDAFQNKTSHTQNVSSKADGGFKKGFLIGISNPKDIIFFSSFFPQFITVHPDLNTSLLVLISTWIVIDFLTLSIVYKITYQLANNQIYTKLLGGCGGLLILISFYSLYTSLIDLMHYF